ncbi:MAG: hypothetical protein ACYS0E_13960 [Planctomycetota bacterium]
MRFALLLILLVGCSRSDDEVDRLLAALRSGDKQGRELADLGPEHADGIPAILAAMESDERRFVQTTCLEALLSMDAGDEARSAIETALESRDAFVADRAALVHWKLYQEQSPGLDRLVRRAPSDLNARMLLEWASPLPPGIVAELVRDADLTVLAALRQDAQDALPRIAAALKADTADERIRAARAHFRVSDRLQPALDVLVEEFKQDNLFLRQRIHAIWIEMLREQPDGMRHMLKEMAKDENEAVRVMATQMLAE